jgi:pyrroloquinoline quinone biosynthesis protein D
MKAIEGDVLVRRPEVMLERIGGDAVLNDRASGCVHVINGSAARIWELCDGARTTEQVTDALAASYGISADDVAADVTALAHQFRSLGLLA